MRIAESTIAIPRRNPVHLVELRIPKMLRQESGLVQKLWLLDVTRTSDSSFLIEGYTSFCDSLRIWAKSPFFLL